MKEKYLKWLKEKQYQTRDFHNGGFSPYPECIKAAGVISTAKALEAIMLYSNPEEWYEDKTIADGIEFLLRAQLDSKYYKKVDPAEDGGFPPMGDLELITYRDTPEATAEAVRILSMYHADTENISLEKRRKIKTAIYRGLRWLIGYLKRKHMFSLSFLHRTYGDDPEINRTSLNLAIDLCLNTIPLKYYDCIGEDLIEERVLRVDNYVKFLEQYGYLPFNLLEPENPSVVNTAEGIRLINEIINKDHCRYEYPNEYRYEMDGWKIYLKYDPNKKINKILERSKEFIVSHLDQILAKDTEYDFINSEHYVEEWMVPSTGPECYSVIPAILYLAGDIKEIKEEIERKMTVPIYVNRGRKEASVKSTAKFLTYNKIKRLKKNK